MDVPTTAGIYCITNTVNGKQYVGSTADLRNRHRQHFGDLRRGQHRNRHLQASYTKHGDGAFTFTILEECPVGVLLEREQHWIEALNTVEQGYNVRVLVDSNRGATWTLDPETCARMAVRMRRDWADPAARAYRVGRMREAVALMDSEARAERTAEQWTDPEIRERRMAGLQRALTTSESRERKRQEMIRRLSDPAQRAQNAEQLRRLQTDAEVQERRAESIRAAWTDPALQEQQRRRWDDPIWREKMLQAQGEGRARRKAERAPEA